MADVLKASGNQFPACQRVSEVRSRATIRRTATGET